jgi:2-amino-4-hydroxy-6-hydroxymethyldihydropteridine diphosphokinase
MARVCLGLGSNLGNRQANLRMALRGLTRMARVEAVSSLYETEPEGPPQPPYYNAACLVETGLEPAPLLRFVKALEHEIGRRRGPAPSRPVDIDILLYGDRALTEADLVIPHPRMAGRAFVLVPLAEVAPEVIVPGQGRTVAEMARAIGAGGVQRIAEAGWDGVAGQEQRVRL